MKSLLQSYVTTPKAILSIKIGGDWTAADFGRCFGYLNVLYNTHALMDFVFEDESTSLKPNVEPEAIASSLLNMYHRPWSMFGKNLFGGPLKVRSIEYHSPGHADLLGIGKILEVIADLIKHYRPNEMQRAEIEIKKLEADGKRIEILHKHNILLKERMETLKMIPSEIERIGKEHWDIQLYFDELSRYEKILDVEIKGDEPNRLS